MKSYSKEKWNKLCDELYKPLQGIERLSKKGSLTKAEKYHLKNLRDLQQSKRDLELRKEDVIHLVFLATYNESIDVLEPSVQALLDVDYDLSKIYLCIAYEERGGEQTKLNAEGLVKKYGGKFGFSCAIMHPDGIVGEIRGKGGNITYAAKELNKLFIQQKLNAKNIIVTTLDSDHRTDKQYFGNLSYTYIICPPEQRKHTSFQPVPMFLNNIWDVPAPMRVVATGNSFWMMVQCLGLTYYATLQLMHKALRLCVIQTFGDEDYR